MSVLFVAPGTAMFLGDGKVGLWKPLPTASTDTAGGSIGGASPPSISGISGWWDASGLSGMQDASGRILTTWYQPAASVRDQSGAGAPLASYASALDGTTLSAVPRVNGLLGGAGAVVSGSGLMQPTLSPYQGLVFAGAPPGSTNDWTWWLVWSRPNWRQGTNIDGQPSTLLSSGSVPIAQIDNSGGAGRLILLPDGSAAVLSAALTRRHTHSLILRNSASGGVDAWLDGAQVATGVACSLPASPSGPTYLLHDGTQVGAAQCWFHEAAVWPRALSDSEVSTLDTYAGRWTTGPRRGITLVVNGQSNAINYALNDGAALLLARGIAWHLGALAYNVVASAGDSSAYTMAGGHGLYPAVDGSYPGSFVDPSGAGATADPTTWPLGTDGIAVHTVLGGLAQEDLDDIRGLLWPWNETDSLRDYSEEATFSAAAGHFLTLERAMIGRDAAALPLIWWNAIPYGTAQGMQMHREVTATLAADNSVNVVIGNPQTSDSNPRGSSWDSTTGLFTGGDFAHRDATDNQRFAMLAAPVAARAMLEAGAADTISVIPVGVPAVGGPRISHVYREDNSTLVLTIAHDGGTDLIVPLQAAYGAGFTVMDGGSVTNPGNLVAATSCQRLDPTHLRLALASPLANPSPSCGLCYPYGSTQIGRGNAVTDNYREVSKPDGWDIGSDLGVAWNLNFPLAATTSPIPLSDTPT
jgi:hypothetical protein